MIFFAPAVRASRLPLVMWAHGVKTGRHWLNWLVRRVPPDLAICSSRYTQKAFALHFPSARTAVVYAPVEMTIPRRDDAQRAGVRKEFRTPNDAIVIVQVSRMLPLKGHRLLIEVLSDLRTKASWQCWIVGGAQTASEETYIRNLEAQVRAEELDDRIQFLGQRTDVPRILAASDIYCQPNERADSFAVVFVEAMLAGLPVVTSALGGAIEFVDSDSGILVPPNDRHALSQALGSLLSDSTLRRRVGAGGPARAHRFCEPAARLQDLRAALEALLSSVPAPESSGILGSE
jgi:glycosyltransferase involved in cell wall biosynthesis